MGRRAGRPLPDPVRPGDGRARHRLPAGGRPVRVDEAGVGPARRRARLGALLGLEPALGGRVARVRLDGGVVGLHPPDRHQDRRRLRVQAGLHLDHRHRGDHRPAPRQVDPEPRRDRARRRPQLLLPDGGHLRRRARRPRLRRRRLQADERGLHRPRPAAALQLCRLRAAERRGGGDAGSAPRRAQGRGRGRDRDRALLRRPDLRHRGGPALVEGERDRRLPGRREHDVHRVRIGPSLPARGDGARLHLRPRHRRRRLDHRLRPRARRCRVRRRVRPAGSACSTRGWGRRCG